MLDWIYNNKWKSLLIYTIGVLIIPIVTNFASTFEAPWKIFANPSPWLIFWGTYLSASSSFGMIIITAISIFKNLQENEKNRELQNRNLQYQVYQSKIENYKKVLTDALSAFSPKNLESLVNLLKKFGNSQERNEFVEYLYSIVNEASNNVRICFSDQLDDTEKTFLQYFESERIIFADKIKDLLWIPNIPNLEHNRFGSLEPKFDTILKRIEEYKLQEEHIVKREDSHRIWNVITSDFKYKTYPYSLLDEMAKPLFYELFYEACMNFIKYENQKAKKILNGSEQDK